MPSSPEPTHTLHPVAETALALLVPGEKERLALDDEGKHALAESFSPYLSSTELRVATEALVELAYMLETNHKCPAAARQVLDVVGLATAVLEAQNAALKQDATGARLKFSQFSGAKEPEKPAKGSGKSSTRNATVSGSRHSTASGSRNSTQKAVKINRAPRRV